MAKQSALIVVVVYGLLITSVLGSNNENGDSKFQYFVSKVKDLELESCSWKAIGAGALVGTGAVLAAPAVLGAVGFTSAGVVAGSIAASLQGPAVAAGSYFALAQSAGAAGLAVSTQVGIGAVAGAVGYEGYKVVSGCKEPDCNTEHKP